MSWVGFRRSFVCIAALFLALAGCNGDDGEEDFCTCADRIPSTPFGFGESCYDGCNWTECATGNTTGRACIDAGPGDGGTCMPPEEATVSCEPLPEGTTEPGCSGLTITGSPVPGGDGDTVWPIGCEVEYPFCLDAYPTTVASCICQESFAPSWSCPE